MHNEADNSDHTEKNARQTREAWGKTNNEKGEFHPLAHHCMDVAAVFARMMKLPVIRNRMETAAERPLTDVDSERLSALVFLHDVGKLHPGFQAKGWPPALWRRERCGHSKEGWAFLQLAASLPEHPFHKTMREMMTWGQAVVGLLGAALAHHGQPVGQPTDPTLVDWDRPSLPHYQWREEAGVMGKAMRRWFARAFETGGADLPDKPQFHHLVAGLIALSDWIGSDTRFFKYQAPFTLDYDSEAHGNAATALKEIGLELDEAAFQPAPSFAKLTGHTKPNAAQCVVGNVEPEARLLILEAETGSGKTEAALWHFTQLLAAGKVSGLYFAVPTRAAARQLHLRVHRMLSHAFDEQLPEAVLAIPGMLRAGDFEGRRLPDWKVLWDDADSQSAPRRWAAEHATRFLAAPVAVGTVDQAMLASLQIKHAHLRGSALNRSLLVIDEVHASDAYMTEILKRLTEEHLATGGYAMLMSATLGARARSRLTGEVLPSFKVASETPYPAVWIQGEPGPRAVASAEHPRQVHLETVPTMDPAEAAKKAIAAAERGARVLVIRNTVDKVVETWRATREAGKSSLLWQVAGGPALHHGRFAVEDRALLDEAVEKTLAPYRLRKTQGCIVIGTQTLEQSLDIDADLLITDLCPIDVLLQRIGRLHRHDLPRPDGFETAHTWILLPENGLEPLTKPDFCNGLGRWKDKDGINGIYQDLAGLELTNRLIKESPVWRIPEMNRALVEGATHPNCIEALIMEMGREWDKYNKDLHGSEMAQRMIAEINVLDRGEEYGGESFPSADEKIMTRLGEEGVILSFEPSPGPFGKPVTRIALPARRSHGIMEEDLVKIEKEENGLILSVAEKRFRYSREGLIYLKGL